MVGTRKTTAAEVAAAMANSGGVIKAAARALGISPKTVRTYAAKAAAAELAARSAEKPKKKAAASKAVSPAPKKEKAVEAPAIILPEDEIALLQRQLKDRDALMGFGVQRNGKSS